MFIGSIQGVLPLIQWVVVPCIRAVQCRFRPSSVSYIQYFCRFFRGEALPHDEDFAYLNIFPYAPTSATSAR